MIRDEIAEIARLASQSVHNFTQGVDTVGGYYSVRSRNYYTTRDGKVRIDINWGHATVHVKTTMTGFWTFLTGTERWKEINLTNDERTLMADVYNQLDACFDRQHADRQRESENEEKLRAEKAIVESAETRLLRSVLKGKYE
jgi:hypothetical protein